jgi:hypothetical protein
MRFSSKKGFNFNSCPKCESANISRENNGTNRKPQIAQNVFIEPLTCDDCGAAVTRFYHIKNRTKNDVYMEYAMSVSSRIDE